MNVLGLHGGVTLGQHEPAAALIVHGHVKAVFEEERYNRIKSSYGMFPEFAITKILSAHNLRLDDVDLIVVPGITYGDVEARWKNFLLDRFGSCPRIMVVHHQEAHLATAFYGCGVQSSLVFSLDGTGDASCGFVARASRDTGIEIIEEIPTSNSLGFFYTLMTYFLGFIDGDEYKVMGLAPYGNPTINLDSVIRVSSDGWELNQDCINNSPQPKSPFEPLYSNRVGELLDMHPRARGALDDRYSDLASSVQLKFEEAMIAWMTKYLRDASNIGFANNICYAGGCALNCSANRKLLQSLPIGTNLYVSPLASDRGLALGCAYLGAVDQGIDPQPLNNAYLGEEYTPSEIEKELTANGIKFEKLEDPSEAASADLNGDLVVGWFQGRSEAGARALGNRSILASAKTYEMRDKVNASIKYREKFRPFAPAILETDVSKFYETTGRTYFPDMTITLQATAAAIEKIPAVVHVDNTSRVQTVSNVNNQLFKYLIEAYSDLSDLPVVMNTSFNLKGQPIVESPRDAIMTFFGCGLDVLYLENYRIAKA